MLKEKLNDFKMFPNELVEQMYARLNVLVEDINALEISPLTTSDIIRKVLHSLHKPKYNIVTVLLMKRILQHLKLVRSLEKFSLMRCLLWVKLILQMPRRILHLKLRVITSPNRKTSTRLPHQLK